MKDLTIKRRLGIETHELPGIKAAGRSAAANNCPDVFELTSGDIAIIGIKVTPDLIHRLPADAGCGPDEEIVLVPREVWLNAVKYSPQV